ncbi:hypothetical protein [Stenotrophomonas sp. NPDC078853]|uniref:hypothetical protein n=1 Tax=Stenotrophomonas sp. NPDC078853 TaxID=3364534 RepID=UPI0038500735
MSAPVDVLASYAQDTGAFRVTNKAATELAEACAAFAELIEAAEETQADAFILGMEIPRLVAALARVRGAA